MNTSEKHFEMILLNVPLDQGKIHGKSRLYKFFYVATANMMVVYCDSQKVTTTNMNDTL